MTSAVASAIISDAKTAHSLLNGILCLYKPSGWGLKRVLKELKNKLSADLNQMQPPPRQERIEIRRIDDNERSTISSLENELVVSSFSDGKKRVEVVKGLSYTDHPLIAGERYRYEDFKLIGTGKTGKLTSGVYLLAINKGIRQGQLIYHSRWMKTHLVSGRFGIATDTYFHTGRVLEKSTYGAIKRQMFEKLLASIQSTHQRLSFLSAGVPLESERAYELASQGLVRPAHSTAPLIYAIKCVDFKLPDFTLEVKSINEDEKYLMHLIHEVGLKLRSVAACTKLHCTNVGPFGLEDALLMKHWSAENIVNNSQNSQRLLKDFNLYVRDPLVNNPEHSSVSETNSDYRET